jgi:pyruvate/2-oxoglutarate dehydrogenase complex dihydrolipoamide dehydrogenase (E3) component
VTLTQRGEQLLRNFDREVGEVAHQALVEEGIDVLPGVTYVPVEQHGARLLLTIRVDGQEQTLERDALLVATGGTPNTETLDLPVASIRTGARGEIVVDEHLRTSNPRVFAAGDVTLGAQFVYVAAHKGAVAAENALGGTHAVDLRAVPGVIFIRPSIATIGLTEEARRAGHEPRTGTLPLKLVPRVLVNRDERGVIKIVAGGHTGEVLGVHFVAENAGDAIYTGVLAVHFRLTVQDLTDTSAPYLTNERRARARSAELRTRCRELVVLRRLTVQARSGLRPGQELTQLKRTLTNAMPEQTERSFAEVSISLAQCRAVLVLGRQHARRQPHRDRWQGRTARAKHPWTPASHLMRVGA